MTEEGNKSEMEEALYKDRANYYDLIYSFKNYKEEADRIKDLIGQFKKSGGNDLLEVACGTGKHLEQFKDQFSCIGVDLNNGMLDVAKQRLGDIELKQADMTDMDLGRQFDVITCLFSSIGYVKTYENLQRTLEGFSRHLKPGGVVIIEPWFTKETYNVGTPHMTTYDGDDIKIARINVSKADGDISILDMHFLVGEKDKDVTTFVDHHELGMFDTNRTLDLMKQAGLDSQFLKDGLMEDRGLFIGIKP